MVRSPCCEKVSVKRGVWTVEEDAKLLSFASKNGSGNWTSVSKKAVARDAVLETTKTANVVTSIAVANPILMSCIQLFSLTKRFAFEAISTGLKSCGKSCRVRWNNHLRPDLKQDNFNPQEEDLIIKLHAAIGSRWSIIAQQLPGRTDNDVKNYWNTKLKKKLSQMGIDPVTHKPFSKLIADYGNIGGSSEKSSTINKDLKNAIQLKPEPQGFRNFNSQSKQPPTSPPPKMEPTENSFLFNRNHTDNLSIDHTQHQGIPIVTSASNCIDLENEIFPIFGEGCLSTTSSSPPSTSSTYSTAAQEALPVPFSWNDFLLEDAFAPNVDNQEQENMVSQIENVTRQSWNRKEDLSQQATSNEFQLSSSSDDITFVEAILGQENEMFISFPHLMEEPFNY